MVAVKVNQRLLTGSDIFSFRSRHNFTQLQAAEIFGGGPNAFSKYENEQVAQNRSMDLLIRVADAVPEAMEWLKVRAGIDADSPAFQPFEIFEVATAERTFRSVVDWIVEEESFLFVEPFDQTRATAVASNEDEYVNAA
jgi:transcriptional regulator with XRE-family HTH domain